MLKVISLDAALDLVLAGVKTWARVQSVPLGCAGGRVLAQDAVAGEDLPAFSRSMVDGYAVLASDTFGASAAQPPLLRLAGEVKMGERAAFSLSPGECAAVWTGGELPQGADAMVMLEDAEALGGGWIAIESPSAPGRNIVFRGDDAKAGETVAPAGKRLSARDIGALAALGYSEVSVLSETRVCVLSTGDELIDCAEAPAGAQIRDCNGPMLTAACGLAGAKASFCGRVPDDEDTLLGAMRRHAAECELLLLSGGSSAGAKDAAARCLDRLGEVFFHGIAVKPGKPTLAGRIGETLVVGLPGHPAAAYMMFHALVYPALAALQGQKLQEHKVSARLSTAAPSNHGREELVAVRLEGDRAVPIAAKSGLVVPLARADGYVRIPRDTEGLMKDALVDVILF